MAERFTCVGTCEMPSSAWHTVGMRAECGQVVFKPACSGTNPLSLSYWLRRKSSSKHFWLRSNITETRCHLDLPGMQVIRTVTHMWQEPSKLLLLLSLWFTHSFTEQMLSLLAPKVKSLAIQLFSRSIRIRVTDSCTKSGFVRCARRAQLCYMVFLWGRRQKALLLWVIKILEAMWRETLWPTASLSN